MKTLRCLCPVYASGDILPVLFSGALVSGPEAVVLLVKYRLSLLAGEWWENPESGFRILESLWSSCMTDADASALSSMITEYLRETEGVLVFEDVQLSVSGRCFSFSCRARTEEGTAVVSYDFE